MIIIFLLLMLVSGLFTLFRMLYIYDDNFIVFIRVLWKELIFIVVIQALVSFFAMALLAGIIKVLI